MASTHRFKDGREKVENWRRINKSHHVNNFSDSTIRKICDMKEDETLADYTIIVEGEEFKVHKLILVCSSDYFQAMLTRVGMKESLQDSVVLQDETITKAAFKVFLDLAYSGEVLLNGEIFHDVVACMSHLHVENGLLICEEYLQQNLTVWNFLEFLNIAEKHFLENSIIFCYEFILPHLIWYFENIPDDANQLTLEQFENIIPEDGVSNESEKNVFDVVCQWLEHDKENRSQYVPQLMQHVRFSLMSPNDLELVKQVEYVKDDPDCKAYLKEAIDYQSAPLLRQLSMQNSRTEVRNNPSLFLLVEKRDRGPYNKAFGAKFNFSGEKLVATTYQELGFCLKEFVQPAIAVCRGFIFVCGGFNKANTNAAVSDCSFYDPRFNRWSNLPNMLDARADFALVSYKDEMLIAVGGTRLKIQVLSTCDLITQSVEIFKLDTQQWSMITALPKRLPIRSGIPMNEKNMIYVASNNSDKNSCKILGLKIIDGDSYQWETLEELDISFIKPMLVECEDKVYVVEGFGSNAMSLQFKEAFSAGFGYLNSWNISSDTNVTCANDFKALCMENERLYALVGGDRGNAYIAKRDIHHSALKFEEFFQVCDFPTGVNYDRDEIHLAMAKIPHRFLP